MVQQYWGILSKELFCLKRLPFYIYLHPPMKPTQNFPNEKTLGNYSTEWESSKMKVKRSWRIVIHYIKMAGILPSSRGHHAFHDFFKSHISWVLFVLVPVHYKLCRPEAMNVLSLWTRNKYDNDCTKCFVSENREEPIFSLFCSL